MTNEEKILAADAYRYGAILAISDGKVAIEHIDDPHLRAGIAFGRLLLDEIGGKAVWYAKLQAKIAEEAK